MLQTAMIDLRKDMKDRLVSMMDDFNVLTDTVKINFKNLEDEVALLKKAMVTLSGQTKGGTSKIKVPKSFNGSRNSIKLENFLWDIE